MAPLVLEPRRGLCDVGSAVLGVCCPVGGASADPAADGADPASDSTDGKRGTNKWYVYTFIADRPIRSRKDKIRALTSRLSQHNPRDVLVRLNQIMRGWANTTRKGGPHRRRTYSYGELSVAADTLAAQFPMRLAMR